MQATKLISNVPLLTNYTYSCSFFNINSIYAQSLRWKVRKPSWLPRAKTKMFKVPPRPVIPEDESKEILRLFNNYRTYMRSIRAHFVKVVKESEKQLDQEFLDKVEDEDFKRCFEINEKWNKQVAAEREVRLSEEKEIKKAEVLQKLQINRKRLEDMKAEVDAKVRETQKLVSTFITKDNIDQAIEDALSETVDYNKALQADGTWYTDKSGLPMQKNLVKIQINQ